MRFSEMYLDLMVCVLLADNRVDRGEKKLFLQMLNMFGVDRELQQKYEQLLDKETYLDSDQVVTEIAKVLDPETLTWLVRDAFLMANADGIVSPEEVEVVDKLLEKAKVPEDLYEQIHSWGMESIAMLERGYSLFTYE